MNKTLKSGTREVVYKVYKRCLLEKEAGTVLTDLTHVFERTAELTGKSLSTVRRIVQEGVQNNSRFSTPKKHRSGRPKKKLDDFDLCSIRQKIQHFYTVRKQAAAEQAFQSISAEVWRKSCEHVIKIERDYYERGHTLYDEIDHLVINLQNDSSSVDTSESDDEMPGAAHAHGSGMEFSGVEYLEDY